MRQGAQCGLVSWFLVMGFSLASDPSDLKLETRSLKRSDLPDDFPYQALDKGFAVLRLRITNGGNQDYLFEPAKLKVRDQKNKQLRRARSTDITPKIVKIYSSKLKRVSGQGQIGGQTGPYPRTRTARLPSGSSTTGVVSLDTVQEIRTILEAYEIQQLLLAPGDTVEGFYYVKSKRTGAQLNGSVSVREHAFPF